MDHMFIMKLAALLFGGGIASCLFPGKSRMSHVLFLLLILAETAVAHATIPDGWWFLLPGVVSVLLRLSFKGGTESGKGGKALLSLHATDGTIIIRKSKFPQNPKRSVRFSGKRTKRSVQKRKARNTQKAETKVL